MQAKKVGIIGGSGVVGSHFAQFFKNQGCSVEISHLGSELSNEDIVRNSEVVLFAVRPMRIVPELILELRKHIPTGLNPLWIDCTSYQGLVGRVVEAIQPRFAFLGAHPQCRPPESGTLKGHKLLVTSHPRSPQPDAEEWNHWCYSEFLPATEAKVIEIGWEEHDRLMKMEKMMPHMFSSLMAQMIVGEPKLDIERLTEISGPFFKMAFALMCRHLSSGELGSELITEHPDSLRQMKQLEDAVANMRLGQSSCPRELFLMLQSLPEKIGTKHVAAGDELFKKLTQAVTVSGANPGSDKGLVLNNLLAGVNGALKSQASPELKLRQIEDVVSLSGL